MVFPITLQAAYHASDAHEFHLAGASGRARTRFEGSTDRFTADRIGNASKRAGMLLAG
jgi:hypothetical protein